MLYRHPQFQYIYKRPWAIKKAWLAKHGYFKKLARYSAAVFSAASLAIINIAVLHMAHAASGYQASDVLGQRNGDGTANFTTGDANHYDSTNYAGLARPSSVALDPNHHRLFVGDCGTSRVNVWDLDSSNNVSGNNASGRLISYVIGQADFTSYDNTVSQNRTSDNPCGLAYDAVHDRLFVNDLNYHRVLIYDLSGGISNGMNAANVLGQTDFVSSSYSGTPSQSNFDCAFQSGRGAIAYDPTNDRLFVPDCNNNRVLVFDVNPVTITDGENASNVLGQTDYISSGSATTQNGFNLPMGVTYDDTHNRLFVLDRSNHRVLVFDVNPATITDGENAGNVLGQADYAPHGCNSGGTSSDAQAICEIEGNMAYDDANDKLWMSDFIDIDRVLQFDLSSGISNNMAAADVLGQIDGGSFRPDFKASVGDAANFMLSGAYSDPNGSAVDTVHHPLFVGDINSRILVYNLDSNNSLIDPYADYILGQTNYLDGNASCSQKASGGFYTGMLYDSAANRLFISDSGCVRVLVYDFSGGISDNMSAAYVIGYTDFSGGSGSPSQNIISDAEGLAYDTATKQLFVSDTFANRVMVFDLSGGITDGMNASNVLGQTNFSNTTSDTSQTKFDHPVDLAYSQSTKHLFVTDENNNRVLEFDLSGGITDGMNAAHVLGQPNFGSNGTASTASGLDDAWGLGFDDANQHLFVSDMLNNRVLMFDVSSVSNGMNASFVFGQPDFTSNGPNQAGTVCRFSTSAGSQTLCAPQGDISFDYANRRLYVPDGGNNRVLTYDMAHITTTSLPSGTVGSSYSQTINKTGGQGTVGFDSTVSGSLPPGVSWDENAGTLSGTPTSAGTYNFTLSLSDDNGAIGIYTDHQSYTVTVNPAGGGDTTPPSAPSGLHTTGTTCTTISLAWTAATDNVGVQGYYIYRDGGGAPIASTAGTSYTDTGLTQGSSHTYTVTAYDAAANQSAPSNQISASTLNNCGGSNPTTPPTTPPSSNPSPTPTPPATPPASTPIDLNELPPVTSGDVCSNLGSASAGQIYTFTAQDGSNHKITILQVGADSIVVQIDNLPKTLHVGDVISQDINNDGVPDICIAVISITGGNVEIKISRIIFATAPGGHTSSGFGAGNTKAGPHKAHKAPLIVKFVFPWLLFVLLGLAALRLFYQSWKERRLLAKLTHQLEQERTLSEEKTNFLSLSSHYLRTPVAAISNGIELMASSNPGSAAELKELAHQLSASTNNLLAKATYRAPAEVKAPDSGRVINPLAGIQPLAAGFIQIASVSAITFVMIICFIVVLVADFIIKHIDIYNISLVNFLIQIAALIVAAVFLYTGLRSYRKQKELRERVEVLLNQQRELDSSRDLLIKDSLNDLKVPLAQLKSKLQVSMPANPQMAKPALNGVAQLEGLINKFTIAASLESGSLGKVHQTVDLSQLVSQTVQRYSSVLQSRNQSIEQKVPSIPFSQDRLLLTFVVDSLLSNAIKYSPQGGQITISARQSHKGIEIRVKDSGPGIDEAKQAQLFQPFSRAENAAEDFNQPGVGLSLYLDKLVMQYLGGDIGLDSKPGHGTAAGVTLPA